jgi:hypothetical protein
MSFAMKRKAGTLKLSNQKNPLGIGFSLNNPRRVGAHTGEPQTQTPYRGTGVRGYGSDGKTGIQTNSQYICPDAFDIPHISVKNTRGYLSVKNKWLNRGYPYTVVKDCTPPTYDMHLNKIKGDIAKNTTAQKNNGNCMCPTKSAVGNYQKDILKMNYTVYYNSHIFKRECIPLPADKAHYPPQNVKKNKLCNTNNNISLEEFIEIQNNPC